jgi:hypothetical protein
MPGRDCPGGRQLGGRARRVAASAAELVAGFQQETDLERRVCRDPELLHGLAWGKPRTGHPEGTVGAHVADLIETIERWGETGDRRAELRFLALVHHAMRARRLAERYTADERLLATIELHHRPYSLWRRMSRTGRVDESAFDRMRERIMDVGLFIRFVELDGSTEGKKPEPVEWLKDELRRREGVRE